MANQNPQMTFGGPNPPLTLYLTNESRARRRTARGSGARRRGIVLDGGVRIPTRGRPRAVGIHTVIRSLQRVLDGVREGNLKVYGDPGMEQEISFGELVFLNDTNTVRNVSTRAQARTASHPDPELDEKPGIDNAVVIDRRARQEAELEARTQIAEDLEERARAARADVDRQEAWMEYRALIDVASPDFTALESHLKEAAELGAPWFDNAVAELAARKASFDKSPHDEPPEALVAKMAEVQEPEPADEPAPDLGDSDGGAPDGENTANPSLPAPLDDGTPEPPDPESDEDPDSSDGEENGADDASQGEDLDGGEEDAAAEDPEDELTLDDLKGMKRAALEQLAEKHGIDNPGDRSLYPNIGVLAESLMSHVAGEAEEDKNNG